MDKLIASTLNDEPQLPSEIASMPISNVLEKTIMQCLQKDRDNRVLTSGELIRLLRQ
jgi:hypothetical protein